MTKKHVPVIKGVLRQHMIEIPEVCDEASGIRVNGRLIKSLAFTTDVAIIKNINAHGIIAVYPFTPHPAITQAILEVADVPVFCGVGGSITTGKRSRNIARHAEYQGAAGVVVNASTPNDVILEIGQIIDIPIIVTVVSERCDFAGRIAAGASIFNVSAASATPSLVAHIRNLYPQFPIIATGGPNEAAMMRTIEAGANCITYTPPTPAELLSDIMQKHRGG